MRFKKSFTPFPLNESTIEDMNEKEHKRKLTVQQITRSSRAMSKGWKLYAQRVKQSAFSGDDYPVEIVKKKFMKLDSKHVNHDL